MAGRRLTASDILERLDNDEFGLSSGEESDFEGEGVISYRPPGLEDPLDGLVDEEELGEGHSDNDEEYSDAAPPVPSIGHFTGIT